MLKRTRVFQIAGGSSPTELLSLYFFDAGVYQAIRPRGPLDAPEEIAGPALETLVLQQLRALNDYRGLGYSFHYWGTAAGDEVDFVLYGERGLTCDP